MCMWVGGFGGAWISNWSSFDVLVQWMKAAQLSG